MKLHRQGLSNIGSIRWLLQVVFLITISFGATTTTFGSSQAASANIELAVPAKGITKRTASFTRAVNRLHFLAVLNLGYERFLISLVAQQTNVQVRSKHSKQYRTPSTKQLLQKVPAAPADCEPAS